MVSTSNGLKPCVCTSAPPLSRLSKIHFWHETIGFISNPYILTLRESTFRSHARVSDCVCLCMFDITRLLKLVEVYKMCKLKTSCQVLWWFTPVDLPSVQRLSRWLVHRLASSHVTLCNAKYRRSLLSVKHDTVSSLHFFIKIRRG